MGARIEAREGRFPPFTVHGAPLDRDRVRAAGGQRPGQVVRAAGRARHRRDDRDRAGRDAATTPSGCCCRPARRSARRATVDRRVPHDRRQHRRARARAGRGPGRPVLGGVPDRRRRARRRARGWCSSGVGVNWTRAGFLRILERMGAIVLAELEPAGNVRSRTSRSRTSTSRGAPIEATTVEADEVPLAIDELPLVALLGCFAEGETVVRGAGELRVKESDRIATVVEGLRGLGADDRGARPTGSSSRGTGGLRGGADRRPRRPPAGAARRGRRAGLGGGRRGGRDGGGRGVLSAASPTIVARLAA